jgi:hypothetical protein
MEQHYRTPLKSVSRHTREKALNNFEKTINRLSGELSDDPADLWLQTADKETIHVEADQALLDYLKGIGHGEVVEKYLELTKKSGGFWYA